MAVLVHEGTKIIRDAITGRRATGHRGRGADVIADAAKG